ncbi:uncharacterized protein LOC116309095 [Actinia tenebrosa]|uniref:Uncharacterized protein LOC116309095 n=1 Tax=Actinia tenebrosa TaxID=6105 RepID=A0A6P8JH14_ACTTE|nr:uncharacterized protein LOC116309095 [Actinia tenebrosa]
MSNKSLMISFLFLLLFPGCDWCSGQTTDSKITGFVKEQLDLVCIKLRIEKDMNVARYLSQNLEEPADQLERFVISKWSQKDYTKHCNTEHKLYNICSQVTSYVTANVTHFVIESAPLELNKYKTQCAYEYDSLKKDSRGSIQIIKLRDKIEGYVGERIEKECFSPSRCRSVTLKINNTEAKISDTNMSFPCLHGRYYEICKDHMNSSYINGTCRVIFVFDNTPVFLNNSRLHCHIRFQNVRNDNYHDPIDSIILLLYKRNDTVVPTASPLPGTTSTTASSTTTSTNGTTTSTEKGLTGGEIAGIVITVLLAFIAIAVGIVCWWKRMCCCQQKQHRGSRPMRMNDEDNQ